MIDPDGLQIEKTNLPDTIKIKQIPPFDYEPYNLENDKEYNHYIKDIEFAVRRSFEYQKFIKYIRENMDMNRCSFLQNVSNEETFAIRIEIHHYPFSLRDIVEIVYRKRAHYHESLEVQMVAKEVMELHYKMMVGLIPLSETVHELAHSGRLFVPVDKVMGRYDLFVNYYKPFIEPEQLETLNRIEDYSMKHSDIEDTTILNQTNVSYEITDPNYQIPDFNKVTNNMITQMKVIKDNNYMLPNVKEYQEIKHDEHIEPRKIFKYVPEKNKGHVEIPKFDTSNCTIWHQTKNNDLFSKGY